MLAKELRKKALLELTLLIDSTPFQNVILPLILQNIIFSKQDQQAKKNSSKVFKK